MRLWKRDTYILGFVCVLTRAMPSTWAMDTVANSNKTLSESLPITDGGTANSEVYERLILAVREGNLNLVNSLLSDPHCADVNACSGGDMSALMLAVRLGYENMVKALIEKKANFN